MVAGLIHTRSKYNGAFTCESTLLLEYALTTYIPNPPVLPQSFPSIFTPPTSIIQKDSSHSNYKGANYSIALGERGLHWQHSKHSQRYVDHVRAVSLPS